MIERGLEGFLKLFSNLFLLLICGKVKYLLWVRYYNDNWEIKKNESFFLFYIIK